MKMFITKIPASSINSVLLATELVMPKALFQVLFVMCTLTTNDH